MHEGFNYKVEREKGFKIGNLDESDLMF